MVEEGEVGSFEPMKPPLDVTAHSFQTERLEEYVLSKFTFINVSLLADPEQSSEKAAQWSWSSLTSYNSFMLPER